MEKFTFKLNTENNDLFSLTKEININKKPSTMAAFLDSLYSNNIKFDIITDDNTEFSVFVKDIEQHHVTKLLHDLYFVFNPNKLNLFNSSELSCLDSDHNDIYRVIDRKMSNRGKYRYGYLCGLILPYGKFTKYIGEGYLMVSVYSEEPSLTILDMTNDDTIDFKHVGTDVKLNIFDTGEAGILVDSQYECLLKEDNLVTIIHKFMDEIYL